MSLADDLRAARALIDTPEKWTQNAFERRGCYCALGAVSKIATGNSDFDQYFYIGNAATLALALERELPTGSAFVSDFNDDEGTTHNDILALFDRAIQRAETTPSNDQQNEREQT